MTYRIELGKRIKTARRRAGIRQLDVAEKLDVGQATVSGWENGAYAPDDDVLHQLAELFHVDAEDLIGTQPPAGSTDDFSNTVMDTGISASGRCRRWRTDRGKRTDKLLAVAETLLPNDGLEPRMVHGPDRDR